ncbi:MAG: cytochrome c biogenesis protein CcsA [Cyanobacteria bacterium]|nr:cytochrome c biogenesis protein CcsA [Cyanobacteriota bacterium]MDA1020635.1 cytochrome c biogenesis protein CcsA [Cyanobacteriota bacterium]
MLKSNQAVILSKASGSSPYIKIWTSCFAVLKMVVVLCILTLPVAAKEIDLSQFERITVLEQGRYKPLASYARNLLLRFSGRSKIAKVDATQWFAQTVFEPAKATDKKIFLINDPALLEALEIEPVKHRKYSFDQLEKSFEKLYSFTIVALNKEDADRTDLDNEFIRVYSNFNSYHQLLNSFSIFFNHSDFNIAQTTEYLGIKSGENNLFAILNASNLLEEWMSNLDTSNAKQLSEKDKEVVRLALALYSWIETHKAFDELYTPIVEFQVIPLGQETMTIWDLLLTEDSNKPELLLLDSIYQAYHYANQTQFNESIIAFNTLLKPRLLDKRIHTDLELLYNKINPFGNAKFLYGLAFLLIMMSFVFWPVVLRRLSLLTSLCGFALHLFGLVSRVIIQGRPPVTNLYETFIFVALITAMIGLIIYKIVDKNLGLILTSFVALLLLLVSGKFASDGDTMQVLIAVLDSNFWLSTHVVCISIGYAGVFMAGIIGHVYVLQRLFATNGVSEAAKRSYKLILPVLAFGLCFSFLGTMLGGIWADQSWGRFWGWDPKENGALLIVLWSSIIFHARLAGMLKEFGIALASVFACVVVITSWFGINLLGVGLHSYGFTNGLATALYAYYAFEVLFIFTALVLQALGSRQGCQPTQQS